MAGTAKATNSIAIQATARINVMRLMTLPPFPSIRGGLDCHHFHFAPLHLPGHDPNALFYAKHFNASLRSLF
jgi:hypothetical protein